MPPPPARLVLIHGAWAGGWVWDPLIAALAARGRLAEALELPGNGHHPIAARDVTPDDYRNALGRAVRDGPGPVALVGHSGGGMLVTAGAEWFPETVSHGIWIAGMLLPEGRSFDDVQQAVAGPGRRIGVTPLIVPATDGRTSTVPEEAAIHHFFQDLPPETARDAARRLTPQPAAGYRLTVPTGPAFAALPKLYVLATEDRSVLPEAQRLMCRDMPMLTMAEMECGHAPQVAQPAVLAALIDGWLP